MSMTPEGKDLFADFKKTNWQPFERYRVGIKLVNIVGGTPKTPDLIDKWLQGVKNKKLKKLSDKEVAELAEETKKEMAARDPEADDSAIGFRADAEKGLFIEGRQVKAMLKETANVIKTIAPGGRKKKSEGGDEQEGITALKSKVAECLFVEEDKIFLGKKEPDWILEQPIHVETPMGPRNALKRAEVCDDVDLEFTVFRHRGLVVPEKTVLAIFEYAQQIGLGADRSQGRGRFTVQYVVKIEGKKKEAAAAKAS